MYSIILREDGIDRTYNTDSRFDALVLFDILTRWRTRIELWKGEELIQSYKP